MGIGLREVVLLSCLIVAVIIHEVSHGVVALFYGDDTAKQAGRLTLNPIPHIDPLGSVILPAFAVMAGVPAIGWAKPVPVNPARLRNPRRHMLWVGLAGPFTNFALMLAAAAGARAVASTAGEVDLHFVLTAFAYVNLLLGLFNLIPIPPLDGSSLIERFLPREWLPGWWKFRKYGFLVLFGLVLYTDVLALIVRPFFDALTEFIDRG